MISAVLVAKLRLFLTTPSVPQYLDDAEIDDLLESYNLKFFRPASEWMCYFSCDVGRSGYGASHIESLINFTKARGLTCRPETSPEELDLFLKELSVN
jgi:hypothetical protein